MSLSKAMMAVLAAALLLAACAVPRSTTDGTGRWHGRLAIRVESTLTDTAPQSIAAGFELSGSPQAGELILYTPLGSSAAILSWTEHSASLRSAGENRTFASLDALIRHTMGTELPVAALFAWLAGDNPVVPGWDADLSRYAQGSILARHTRPGTQAQLRLILEK